MIWTCPMLDDLQLERCERLRRLSADVLDDLSVVRTSSECHYGVTLTVRSSVISSLMLL